MGSSVCGQDSGLPVQMCCALDIHSTKNETCYKQIPGFTQAMTSVMHLLKCVQHQKNIHTSVLPFSLGLRADHTEQARAINRMRDPLHTEIGFGL